ncbi:dTDP-4-dehydrorhamnose reductase [Phenylobacterium hankyongense]|uniref:dTDP-4-dehydrorhamnose reductase n=1 Tax=Phenylobacterium hankyongense TaxID=1813876 RepID=A0A328B2A2_9CAUL|nr:family 1 glycosylhydrolase [Phenylobacterium hankyongense]RAK60947.1 dTDP-4-dehydrorhamnose reductase [Phenylobacterium hankyongense]
MRELELWGGHECTVNRIGGAFHDQTIRSGHQHRIEDLERFAALGLKALRYPVLWERAAPERPDSFDWRWTDERLGRIRELGMRPIAGLLHHGSGPRYTSLVDQDFAPAFAAYARAAAERYPWVEAWTPVNEPLTTARFSALYGHWYPHVADEHLFWAALLNQIDGTRLAMREIRAVNSAAQLVQTEDLGRTYATRALAHQADFDNARRWMSWDLLCGRVIPGHLMWERLDGFGFGDRLRAIADDPCPPDVLGVNHYLTSDRFLDHRTGDYPPERIGGNEFMAFADVEAVRVALPGPGGLEGALDEAWARYGLPLAVTESHNGCTREEQVRWLREAWDSAERLRGRGVDVRAVTAWALLGTHDWNSLLTRHVGHYEVGAFDVRTAQVRPTALAAELARLGAGIGQAHPATRGPGWWRRDIRMAFRPVFRTVDTPEPRPELRTPQSPDRPLLIVGATGTLGKALARACEWRAIDYRLTGRAELSLDDEDSILRMLDALQPWAVINAAGWVRVDQAEAEAEACMAANAAGAIRLARACRDRDLPCVAFSSDLVFDGAFDRPYLESDAPAPLNVYGASKARAERGILELGGKPLIVRTAAFFSPFDPHNFASAALRTLAGGGEFAAADDLIVSPTYVPDLVAATLDLLIDGDTGLRHLANAGAISWADFARQVAAAAGRDPDLVRGAPAASFGWPARRPARAALDTELGQLMPSLDNAIERYAAMVEQAEFSTESEALADGGMPYDPFLRPGARVS